MAAHRTERLTLHMTAFISFQIFLYFGKILTMQNRSISFLVLYMFSAYVQPELWRGRGIPFACTAKLASNCTCGPQIAVFPDALQPHKVPAESQDFSLFMFCWNCYNGRAQHACILHLHSLSYAPLQKLKQLFMATLGAVSHTEHSELVAPKILTVFH